MMRPPTRQQRNLERLLFLTVGLALAPVIVIALLAVWALADEVAATLTRWRP